MSATMNNPKGKNLEAFFNTLNEKQDSKKLSLFRNDVN